MRLIIDNCGRFCGREREKDGFLKLQRGRDEDDGSFLFFLGPGKNK